VLRNCWGTSEMVDGKDSFARSPYEVLGIPKGAPREVVKTAFREQAKRFHPDRDPSPSAAARFAEVQSAAEVLLHGKPYRVQATPSGAGSLSKWERWFDQTARQRSFPAIFSAACLAGGCALFAGVIYQHIYYPMYNGRLYVPAEGGGSAAPTGELSDQQRQMSEMLRRKIEERRRQREADRAAE